MSRHMKLVLIIARYLRDNSRSEYLRVFVGVSVARIVRGSFNGRAGVFES